MTALSETPHGAGASPYWLVHVSTPDVADLLRALARVVRHGDRVPGAPMTVPGGDCIARCLDPQGAPFSLRSHDAV